MATARETFDELTSHLNVTEREAIWSYVSGREGLSFDLTIPDYNYNPADPNGTGSSYIAEFRWGNWIGGGYGAGRYTDISDEYSASEELLPAKDVFDAIGRAHDLGADYAYREHLRDLDLNASLAERAEAYKNYHLAMAENDRLFVEAIDNLGSSGYRSDLSEYGADIRDIGRDIMVWTGNGYSDAATRIQFWVDELNTAVANGDPDAIYQAETQLNRALNENADRIAAGALPAAREWLSITNQFAIVRSLSSQLEQHPNLRPDILNRINERYGPEILKAVLDQDGYCFAADTLISLPSGDQKPIEQIAVGDIVTSYDGDGNLVPGRVVRTFRNEVSHLLEVHGLKVTPGHVTLCGDGRFAGRHVPIIDILLSDGALVRESGELIRMSTNKPVGELEDQMVKVSYAETSDNLHAGELKSGQMRVGTLLFDKDGVAVSVLDCIRSQGLEFDAATGLVSADGGDAAPLNWFGLLPRPEDYVLRRSRETLEGILTSGE